MPARKFKPIEITTDSPDNIFTTHKLELAKSIINAIDFGLRNKKSYVDFAHIKIRGTLVITLSIDSREYIDLIDTNLPYLIKFEEYEICAKAIKLKNKIQKSNEKVTKYVSETAGSN
jgi:hypothetical protein